MSEAWDLWDKIWADAYLLAFASIAGEGCDFRPRAQVTWCRRSHPLIARPEFHIQNLHLAFLKSETGTNSSRVWSRVSAKLGGFRLSTSSLFPHTNSFFLEHGVT